MTELQTLLRQRAQALLEQKTVAYIIGWGETRFAPQTRPLFIHNPQQAQQLLFNSYCFSNLGKYALADKYPAGKIGMCVRGCETRALNRLIKDAQIQRENLYLLGLPCPGMEAEKCRYCACHNPLIYDELLGSLRKEEQQPAARFAAVEELEQRGPDERYDYWAGIYERCIRCYACRNICPACNCAECYTEQYRTGWQGKQNNRAENMLFGLTRAYHVSDRCIECGECARVCPLNLPLMNINRKLVKEVELLFGGQGAGLDAEEQPALGAFLKDDMEEFM